MTISPSTTNASIPIDQDTPMREILDKLSQQKFEGNAEALKQAELSLRKSADVMSTGKGEAKKIAIMDPELNITLGEVMGKMDRPQAERFIIELFRDIVPHMSSQRQMLSDLETGRAEGGAKVETDPLTSLMAGLIKALPEGLGDLFAVVQTQAQKLTWVDDNQHTITTNMSMEMKVDETIKPTHGRGIKF